MDILNKPYLSALRRMKTAKLAVLCATIFTLVALSMSLVACESADDERTQTDTAPVQVGSKDFTENLILGELYALVLEDKGIPVQRRLGLASAVVHEALISGDVDLYPEYTGTGLLTVLRLPLETDPQKVFDTVQREYAEQFDVTWLEMAPANNSQGIVVTREASERYNITTISDFQREAHNLRFASQGEFDVREDALPLLREIYGPIDFKSSAIFDNALKYEVLRSGQADAAPAYTTEGQLVDPDFVLLEDDKQAWPPYNIAPIIRTEVLELHPEIASVLNALSAGLTSEKMTELNAQVDVEGREFTDVAREYFDSVRDDIQPSP
ncbi:MAG: glycine/betaine ABC transporter substrate-binding protein [Coriobacteriia bacterium]|nr:glycine/betaine ABC transporter substrate-binding protein [Coriobacteriia bacterium]MCL2871173.1 glycine/betaine ABC transporter substrate-binding protein [Coriobacteriia bacterium]